MCCVWYTYNQCSKGSYSTLSRLVQVHRYVQPQNNNKSHISILDRRIKFLPNCQSKPRSTNTKRCRGEQRLGKSNRRIESHSRDSGEGCEVSYQQRKTHGWNTNFLCKMKDASSRALTQSIFCTLVRLFCALVSDKSELSKIILRIVLSHSECIVYVYVKIIIYVGMHFKFSINLQLSPKYQTQITPKYHKPQHALAGIGQQ